MKKLIVIIILFLTIFISACMNISEVSNLETKENMIIEDEGEVLTKEVAAKKKSINEISARIVLDDKIFNKKIINNNITNNETSNESNNNANKDTNVGKNSVLPPEEPSKPSYTQKAVVLTYHHISNNPFSGITITPERFEEDLKMLRDNNFNVISLREMINAMEGKSELPQNAVVITFDDGIESFYNYAYPLLKEYNMPAVQFIITARNESYKPSDNELNPLSPMQITEMFQSGLIDIQSHTHNSHDYVYINSEMKKGPKLTYKIYDPETAAKESDEEYLARITADLITSREIIYKYTGVYPDILSFPFGSYNNKVWNAGKAVGFEYFVTTEPGYNKENSNKAAIYRIRSGDAALNSDKLLKSIIECVNEDKQ